MNLSVHIDERHNIDFYTVARAIIRVVDHALYNEQVDWQSVRMEFRDGDEAETTVAIGVTHVDLGVTVRIANQADKFRELAHGCDSEAEIARPDKIIHLLGMAEAYRNAARILEEVQ